MKKSFGLAVWPAAVAATMMFAACGSDDNSSNVERAALSLLNLLNLVNSFSDRPRSRRDELEDIFHELRGF